MSDLQLLFLVLTVLYGWECVVWLQRGSVLFRTWWGRRWRAVHPSTLLGNPRAGLAFAAPLPPLGTAFVCSQLPMSLSPTAALSFVASSVNPGWRPPQVSRLVRFDEMRTTEARGKQVLVNGTVFLRAASAESAAFLARQLRQIQEMPAAGRPDAIARLIRSGLDTRLLEERLRQFNSAAAWVKSLTNTLFGYLFLFAPAAIWRFGFGSCWGWLLAGLLAGTITTALLFRRAHRRLYPDAGDDRFTHSLIILLSPATALRAHDFLSRPLLCGFHPLAVARVLGGDRQLRQLARQVLREIRHPGMPVCPRPEPEASEAERQTRALLLEAVEEFLGANRVEPDTLVEAPAPEDACSAYCPRCQAQFTAGATVCADCGGMPLVPFAKGTPARHAEGTLN